MGCCMQVGELEQNLTLLKAESIRADRAQAEVQVAVLEEELARLKAEATAQPSTFPSHPIALKF
eukprot:1153543-Rhodomonas_salina.1